MLRSYDPQLGRFMQHDPYDQFASGYVGMGNDPVGTVDPTGGFGGPGGIATPGGFWNGSFLSPMKAGSSLFSTGGLGTLALTTANAVNNSARVVDNVSQRNQFARAAADAVRVKSPVINNGQPKSDRSQLQQGWNAFYSDILLPGVDWVNHNLNPVYGAFNGINSQFTGKDFLTNQPMTRAEGATGLALSVLPGGKQSRVVLKQAERAIVGATENAAAKGVTSALKFGGDEAVVHFGKHADQIMKVTGKSLYNLKNYVDDANWIIQNGTYSSKLNGFYHYMGNAAKGESLFGFVGLKNGGSTISTFHIKTATQLGLK